MFLKKALAASIASALAGGASAAVVTFNDTSLGGNNTFQFDEIILTSVGTSTLTLQDDGNGVLDTDPDGLANGLVTNDTFRETGMIQSVDFRLGGFGVSPVVSGLNFDYQMFIVYEPPAGELNGLTAQDAAGNAIAVFTQPTTATIYYDTNTLDTSFNAATSTAIGSLSLADSPISNCVLPSLGSAQGTCVINANFDSNAAGVWTIGGQDLASSLTATMRLDFNIDETNPAISPTFDEPGGTQVVQITHDGSAVIEAQQVPEPATAALLGGALLGLFGLRRWSKQA